MNIASQKKSFIFIRQEFCENQTFILIYSNNNLLSVFFSGDLGRIWCAESKNQICFAQPSQVFELWPHVISYMLFLFICTVLRSGNSSEIQSLKNPMNEVKLEAWKAFVLVVKDFVGNNKARNYAEFVNNMMTAFRNLSCNMSVKMHNLFSHMN